MAVDFCPVLHRELKNLDKGGESGESAMKFLKTYIEDLDSRTIPFFLAELSETRNTGSSPGECTIFLYEVLARVHGPKIVPHVDEITSTILRTLLSSRGSFALYQACSKVVLAIDRYGIDPLTPDDEKSSIIRSLAQSLSNLLMGPPEKSASGAALCLQVLVEADNWCFAPDDVVNELCLKVAGALEEDLTQTNYHMALVRALVKHNAFVVEPYARSLIRSGLQILAASTRCFDSQKKLSSIQMINLLMEGVDSRSITSEIVEVIDAIEKCQTDDLPSVMDAALEALQTAKLICGHKGSRDEISSSLIIGPTFERINSRRHSWVGRVNDYARDHFSAEFPHLESQDVDSFIDLDLGVQSPMSAGECNLKCVSRPKSLCNNENGALDKKLKGGFLRRASLNGDSPLFHCEQPRNCRLSEAYKAYKEQSEVLSELIQANAVNQVTQATTPSPQGSPQLIAGTKTSSTPQNLVQCLQNSSDSNNALFDSSHGRLAVNYRFFEVKQNPSMRVGGGSHPQNSSKFKGRNDAYMRKQIKQSNIQEDVAIASDIIGSATSVSNFPAEIRATHRSNSACCRVNTRKTIYGKAALRVVSCILVTVFAIIIWAWWNNNDDNLSDLFPT